MILNGDRGRTIDMRQTARLPSRSSDYRIVESPGGSREVVAAGELAQANSAAIDVRIAAIQAIRAGRVQFAHDLVWKYLGAHPESWDFTIDPAIESSLLLRRYDEAFPALVGLLKTPGGNSEQRFVQLSIAAAGLGQVHPEQLEYIQGQLRSWYSNSHNRPLVGRLSQSSSAKDVLFTGFLALGMLGVDGTPYLEVCLQLNPGSVEAAREAAEVYEAQHNYSAERRVCGGIVPLLPAGANQDYFTRVLKRVAGRPDRALPGVIKP
jgi:hypothetical protein